MPLFAALFGAVSIEAGLAGVVATGPAAPIVIIAGLAAWAAVEVAKHNANKGGTA